MDVRSCVKRECNGAGFGYAIHTKCVEFIGCRGADAGGKADFAFGCNLITTDNDYSQREQAISV